ncbi:hypothetical protein BGZ73_006022 [Actinomortierella ambigua]|nr:hypothetical protein BGZ73_006022 [Actinomortierella ambigua]
MTTYNLRLVRSEPEDYNQPDRIEARRRWTESVNRSRVDMEDVVYIDEAGIQMRIRYRNTRAPRDRPTHAKLPENCGPNMSLVVAVDKTGALATWLFMQGAFNEHTFAEFLEKRVFPTIEGRRPMQGLHLGQLNDTRQALPEGYRDAYEEEREERVKEVTEADAQGQQDGQIQSSEDEVKEEMQEGEEEHVFQEED